MGVAERALFDTRRAFDGVAAGYDRSNAENPTLCEMRRRVVASVQARVAPGGRILDLGCGPGTDAVVLGRSGYRVTAIDWSPAMVDEARRRVAASGLSDRVDVRHVGIQQLDVGSVGSFDAAYSNFGPLNCVPDLDAAARGIARAVRPGGLLIAAVIGRVCPWELALYAVRGDWRRARVRFARDMVGVPLGDQTVWTRYYTPRGFARAFESAGFIRVEWRALGLFAPPPYLVGFADRHPILTRRLHVVDDRVGSWPGLRAWGDHFLMILRKV